jgi:hypothetical protein
LEVRIPARVRLNQDRTARRLSVMLRVSFGTQCVWEERQET